MPVVLLDHLEVWVWPSCAAITASGENLTLGTFDPACTPQIYAILPGLFRLNLSTSGELSMARCEA